VGWLRGGPASPLAQVARAHLGWLAKEKKKEKGLAQWPLAQVACLSTAHLRKKEEKKGGHLRCWGFEPTPRYFHHLPPDQLRYVRFLNQKR
jgi:hypothetical protein